MRSPSQKWAFVRPAVRTRASSHQFKWSLAAARLSGGEPAPGHCASAEAGVRQHPGATWRGLNRRTCCTSFLHSPSRRRKPGPSTAALLLRFLSPRPNVHTPQSAIELPISIITTHPPNRCTLSQHRSRSPRPNCTRRRSALDLKQANHIALAYSCPRHLPLPCAQSAASPRPRVGRPARLATPAREPRAGAHL